MDHSNVKEELIYEFKHIEHLLKVFPSLKNPKDLNTKLYKANLLILGEHIIHLLNSADYKNSNFHTK